MTFAKPYFLFCLLKKVHSKAYIFQQQKPSILLWQMREKQFFTCTFSFCIQSWLFKQMLWGRSGKEGALWQPGYQQRNHQLTKQPVWTQHLDCYHFARREGIQSANAPSARGMHGQGGRGRASGRGAAAARDSRDTRGAGQSWGALLWEDRPRAVCAVPPSCSALCFACNI